RNKIINRLAWKSCPYLELRRHRTDLRGYLSSCKESAGGRPDGVWGVRQARAGFFRSATTHRDLSRRIQRHRRRILRRQPDDADTDAVACTVGRLRLCSRLSGRPTRSQDPDTAEDTNHQRISLASNLSLARIISGRIEM